MHTPDRASSRDPPCNVFISSIHRGLIALANYARAQTHTHMHTHIYPPATRHSPLISLAFAFAGSPFRVSNHPRSPTRATPREKEHTYARTGIAGINVLSATKSLARGLRVIRVDACRDVRLRSGLRRTYASPERARQQSCRDRFVECSVTL